MKQWHEETSETGKVFLWTRMMGMGGRVRGVRGVCGSGGVGVGIGIGIGIGIGVGVGIVDVVDVVDVGVIVIGVIVIVVGVNLKHPPSLNTVSDNTQNAAYTTCVPICLYCMACAKLQKLSS